jgi:hypothetical protein
MEYFVIISRILLGLIFVAVGLNGFLHFVPTPRRLCSKGSGAGRPQRPGTGSRGIAELTLEAFGQTR